MNNNSEDRIFDTTLNALTDYFNNLPQSTVKLLNPQKYQALLTAATKVTSLLRSTQAEGKIEIEINTQFNIGSISVDLDSLTIYEPKVFAQIISVADNFEIYPLENGNIRLDITFQSVLKSVI